MLDFCQTLRDIIAKVDTRRMATFSVSVKRPGSSKCVLSRKFDYPNFKIL
jgi:hypothetical protein